MSKKLLRIALTWLLALALPLQGYAAQAMLTCGPAHHQCAGAHDHAAHGHESAAGEADAHHAHQATASKSGPAGKCSACASCCGATALTATSVSIAAIPRLHAPVVASVPTGKASESVGGLERPPRHFLA